MRALPPPGLFVMHDYANMEPKPTWGSVGGWMWFPWKDLNPASGLYDFDDIDAYLEGAVKLRKPAIISLMLYPDLDQDCTPLWVYGGVKGGWPIKPLTTTPIKTFPKWNDGVWDAAMRAMVKALGARYDADLRVAAVWICTARYGETVTDGLGTDTHNPGRFFTNMLNWYADAFPTKPMMVLNTGPTDRLSLSQKAWALGICAKFNSLNRDVRTHVAGSAASVPASGHAEIAQASPLPMGWEHYYAETPNETYWAALTFIALHGTVLDLPVKHLDALAAIPGLWDWLLERMNADQERVGLYVARDTQFPTGDWEHGWLGPWSRGITANAVCYAPGSDGYKQAPEALRTTMQGHGGIGYCKAPLSITLTLPDGNYSVEVVYSPDGAKWQRETLPMVSPSTVTFASAPCWLHAIEAMPTSEPEPPDPDCDLEDDVKALEADSIVQAARLDALDAAVNLLGARVLELERSLAAIHDATQ